MAIRLRLHAHTARQCLRHTARNKSIDVDAPHEASEQCIVIYQTQFHAVPA